MAKSLALCSNIESVYSTTPKNMTKPRFSCKITMSNTDSLDINDDHHYHGILQKRMHIILCYKKQSSNENEDFDGLHIGGWLKESLGSALAERPILAGRLRKSENGGLEIVSNDGGVRCVEVQMPLSLEEFLESKEKNNEVEGKLVYWQDIETSNPQFSPLFYIQVTKFQCGGYSLGISCSLLLADPSSMAKFLKRWAGIHRLMACETEVSRKHFANYTLNFKNGFSGLEYGDTHVSTTSTTTNSKRIMFNISTQQNIIHYSSDEFYKNFMLPCLEEAERKLGTKIPSNFTLITKEPKGDVKVEVFTKQDIFVKPKHLEYELTNLSWEDMRINEVDFQRKNGMIDVSIIHWITCDAFEGVVAAVISSSVEEKFDNKVYITFPCV